MTAARVVFDVMHPYYLPQYTPVARELVARGASCEFVFYTTHAPVAELRAVATREALVARFVRDAAEAAALYAAERPDWVVFGNNFDHLDRLAPSTRTATLYHGIGVKECYYDAPLMQTTVRFCEGEFRRAELLRRFPAGPAAVVAVGFAKLDPLFDGSLRSFDLAAAGLDPHRPTVLYAPTYYPSSAPLLPDDWPAAIADLNLIVKPHQFTYTKSRYRGQLRKFERWASYPNVHLAGPDQYSLLPYMATAAVLVSEASSALFEFAALDRPVVWCDFLDLRWNHRGPLRFRFAQRMDRTIERYRDIGAHARRPEELAAVIRAELAMPDRHAATRRRYVAELIGPADGQASRRIADYLLAAR
ncbi:MAG TPA: CDP-glycerol--poly(glycerophosphate) glycerophosphotransferase [Gammaproteobacteria bacterium]|nr:CDP-glycerol--poly(glycerophosphate) glycerophosphotransferase [Gammaproteobacteria bacterium]